MAGTREGGLKAAATLKAKKGNDFYVRIGRKGGRAEVVKGFGTNRTIASLAGSKGGRISRARRQPRITHIKVQSHTRIPVQFV